MAKVILYCTAIFCSAAIFFSCVYHELEQPIPPPDCDGADTFSYSEDVAGILAVNCIKSGCHDNSQGPERDWRNPEAFKAKAFEARKRILLPPSNPLHMPKDGVLSNEDITTIWCWVEQGASITN
jgi:hypothetical protein